MNREAKKKHIVKQMREQLANNDMKGEKLNEETFLISLTYEQAVATCRDDAFKLAYAEMTRRKDILCVGCEKEMVVSDSVYENYKNNNSPGAYCMPCFLRKG